MFMLSQLSVRLLNVAKETKTPKLTNLYIGSNAKRRSPQPLGKPFWTISRGVEGVWDQKMSKISKWFFGHFLARNEYRSENNPEKTHFGLPLTP